MIVSRKSLIDHTPSPEKWAEARAATKRALAEMTPEEDAAITADALTDPDNPPILDHELTKRVPPPFARPKEAVSLRLDADVLDSLRGSGPGWQTRVNAILRQALALG